MAQNGLAKSHLTQTSRSHSRYFNPYISTYINYRINHHDNAYNKKLLLNHYEKAVLSIGIMVVLSMMFVLVSFKITVGNYQDNIMKSNLQTSKVRSVTGDLHQQVSKLQGSGRLQKIAHKNDLKLTDKNVRNVQ